MRQGEVVSEDKVTVEHDTINEMIVVAAALVDADIRDAYLIKTPAAVFQDKDNALLWEAMQGIQRKGQAVDKQAVHALVSGTVDLEYLQSLVTNYPVAPANIGTHFSALRWDAVRVEATQTTVPTFLRALKDPKASPAQVRACAESIARSLDVKLDRSFMSNPSTVAASHVETMRKRRDMACYEYGIPALDYYASGDHRMIPGAAPAKITLITGLSGSAKSVLAAYIALCQAFKGRRVLFGAWEMGAGETLEMMATISLSLKPDPILTASRYATTTGALNDEELAAFGKRMQKIAEWVRFFDPPFHNDPSKKYSNEYSLHEIHRMVADSGCEVVVYDLWERCIPNGDPGAERRALFMQQQIHKATHTHGIMVCQQKIKDVEQTATKRPMRNTILGSSAWVDIADTIIGVHRPALWKNIDDDTIETLVLKQRFAKWPMCITHAWDGDAMTIEHGKEIPFEHATSARQTDGPFNV